MHYARGPRDELTRVLWDTTRTFLCSVFLLGLHRHVPRDSRAECYQDGELFDNFLIVYLEVLKETPIFATVMINRAECITKLQACKNVVADKFGVHSMRLFGSVARNEQDESSDVDVCVEMEPSLLRRSGLKIYLEELLNCKVDVLRIHKNMDDFLIQQIERDGIIIFQ